MTSLGDAFAAADLQGLPSLGAMEDDRGRSLWVMLVGRDRLNGLQLTANDISVVLRDVYGIRVPRQRITGIFSGERVAVAHRGTAYQLMEAGAQEVMRSGPDVFFIEPERALSGIRTVESLLGSLIGPVRVCDPYADGRTLDMLAACVGADEIRLLTANLNNPRTFVRDLQAFRSEHGLTVDVRQVTPGVLHDRYIIHDGGMLLIGTSLNSIGRRQTFVVSMGPDFRSMAIGAFDSNWAAATAV